MDRKKKYYFLKMEGCELKSNLGRLAALIYCPAIGRALVAYATAELGSTSLRIYNRKRGVMYE